MKQKQTQVQKTNLWLQREGEGWKWGVEISISKLLYEDFPGGSDGQVSFYNAGDLGSIPGSVRSPGEGNGNPIQYYCLENPMDRGTWQATIQWINNKVLLYSTGSYIQYPMINHNGKEYEKSIYTYYTYVYIYSIYIYTIYVYIHTYMYN